MPKNQVKKLTTRVAYSELTDTVYVLDAKGSKVNVTNNFINVFMLWMLGGKPMPPQGGSINRDVNVKDIGEFEIILRRK